MDTHSVSDKMCPYLCIDYQCIILSVICPGQWFWNTKEVQSSIHMQILSSYRERDWRIGHHAAFFLSAAGFSVCGEIYFFSSTVCLLIQHRCEHWCILYYHRYDIGTLVATLTSHQTLVPRWLSKGNNECCMCVCVCNKHHMLAGFLWFSF